MFYRETLSRKAFLIFNYVFLAVTSIVCIVPMVHVLAVSLSSPGPVNSGIVGLWPVGFTLEPYRYVIGEPAFYNAFFMTIKRVVLAYVIQMAVILLSAYPLSISRRKFCARQFYVWFFLITILFGGGLIPTYLVVKATGLIDKLWALVIPGAVPVFYIILLQNFFKGLPDEITEAAVMEGAGHWTLLLRIMFPLSTPALATISLFIIVQHWNAWFDGMIYMNSAAHYPLQTYLQTIVVTINLKFASDVDSIATNVAQTSNKAAQIFIAMLPVLLVYPLLQRYYIKGIVLGSVKE